MSSPREPVQVAPHAEDGSTLASPRSQASRGGALHDWLQRLLEADRDALAQRHGTLLALLARREAQGDTDERLRRDADAQLRKLCGEWLEFNGQVTAQLRPSTPPPSPREAPADASACPGRSESEQRIPVVLPALRDAAGPSSRNVVGDSSRTGISRILNSAGMSRMLNSHELPGGEAVATAARKAYKSYKLHFARTDSDLAGGQCCHLWHFVRSPAFEMIFSSLIMINVIVMAVEAQFRGLARGSQIGFGTYHFGNMDGAKASLFQRIELAFGVLFCIEWVLKVMSFRADFVHDRWNIMDTFIVGAWVVESQSTLSLGFVSPMLLRLLRLFRLMRLVRLVHSMQYFDSLIVITTAIKHSVSILTWASLVLCVVFIMCALFLQTMVEAWLVETDSDQRHLVFQYYGTFSRCFLTMFEITLGNWIPPCRALVENINESYMAFFLLHKLVIGLSVLSVINGVFIQETFKVASQDDHLMMLNKDRAVKSHVRKMTALFQHLDDDGSGTITKEEFHTIADNPRVRMWLAAMELDIVDVDKVFDLLVSDASGELSAQALVKGAARLKGAAKSIDLLSLTKVVEEYAEGMRKLQGQLAPLQQGLLSAGLVSRPRQ